MKIISVLNHFIDSSHWVDPANTLDRVISGNSDKWVDRFLVTLNEYINQYLEIEAEQFPHGSTFRLIG